MRSSLLCSVALGAGLASAAPTVKREEPADVSPDNVYFPLPNGFPNPPQEALIDIQDGAHGTLPNGPPPPSLSPEGVTNLQLIALNEMFEVAFFNELIYNVTNKVSGYDVGFGHDYIVDSLNAILNQEELHQLDANNALEHFGAEKIEPCKYNFPVTDFQSAIALAGTFTDMVLGTLQDVNQLFAENQDVGLVRAVSSVLGNEAQQEGFFRLVQKKRPSAQPFLTTSTRDFAFTAIQDFVVPDSCPNIGTIPLKTFLPLTLETQTIPAETQNLRFSFAKDNAGLYNIDKLRMVYISGQNQPIVKPFMNVRMGESDRVFFEAEFPYNEFIMDGLTIAAVTMEGEQFESADKVAEMTVFGPALIEVN